MKIILICILLTVCSCGPPSLKTNEISETRFGEFAIVKIDSCEYVVYRGYQKGGITHKGNCKNHDSW